MLKIERHCEECVTRLRLSGRIQLNQIHYLKSAMRDGPPPKLLDLSEVTLVDLKVIRFLIHCEDEGIELVQCPLYVREWILREREESAQSEPCRDD
jgi:hypothetical protein